MKTEKEIIEILENYLNVNDVIYAINIPNIASELTEGEEEKTCESCGDRFIPVDKVNYHCQKCQPCKAINTSEQKPTDECADWIHEERVEHNDDNYCPICGKKLKQSNTFTSSKIYTLH